MRHLLSRLKILSLSTVFPNPAEPGLGLFVRSRLQYLSAHAEIRVVAPIPLFDYSSARGERTRPANIPRRRTDGALEVWHPTWFYPPGGTPLNFVALFARLALPLGLLRKRYRFDLIDAHFGHPEGAAAALLASTLGVPFTVTLRGNETRDAQSPGLRRAIANAMRKAARVITVSENLRELAISLGAPPERVKTIGNGINPALFHARANRTGLREKYGIGVRQKAILSAGYLIERKGHHRIIEALATLATQGRAPLLLIAGSAGREGVWEDRIRRQVAASGLDHQVRFLGQQTHEALAELMCACDLLCLASTREGWPNVVHEANACGAPVVTTDVGGVRDMLPKEDYGFIVPPDDPAALGAALGRALDARWDREAIARWGGSRSWEQVAREVFEQFAQVAEETNRER